MNVGGNKIPFYLRDYIKNNISQERKGIIMSRYYTYDVGKHAGKKKVKLSSFYGNAGTAITDGESNSPSKKKSNKRTKKGNWYVLLDELINSLGGKVKEDGKQIKFKVEMIHARVNRSPESDIYELTGRYLAVRVHSTFEFGKIATIPGLKAIEENEDKIYFIPLKYLVNAIQTSKNYCLNIKEFPPFLYTGNIRTFAMYQMSLFTLAKDITITSSVCSTDNMNIHVL